MVFSTCKNNVPGGSLLQIVDIMWAVLLEEQVRIWADSIEPVRWAEERQPDMLLESLIGGDPAGTDAMRKYLDFNLAKNKSLIDGWYRFAEYYMLQENSNMFPVD